MTVTIYYIAVGRDDAKQLFGPKRPTELRALITGWIESYQGPDQLLQFGESWRQLRDHLKAPSEETQLAVKSLFSGNRQLLDEDGFRVAVVRPDAVGAVAHFLGEVDAVGGDDVQATQAQLKDFFSSAVTARQAIAIVHSAEAVTE